MDPDDHATAGAVVPEGTARRELTGDITWCTVIQRTLVSPKLANGEQFFMWYHNGHNSNVSCVSDTALIAASMRARIFKEITDGGYNVLIYVYSKFRNDRTSFHAEIAKNMKRDAYISW